MPYGRGGAGNLQQQATSVQAQTSESRDVEANRPNALDAEEEMARAEAAARSRRDTDPYAHSGRGGAGNWFSPRTLATGGTFVNTAAEASSQAPVSAEPNQTGAVATTAIPGGPAGENRKMGRGGAGNFVWETERERQNELARKEKEQAISNDILKDVESGLAKPGRAMLRHETVKE